MNKFTKEEISLCKQVAKKHKKEIKHGDWYLHLDEILLWKMPVRMAKLDYVIPLWTISDCLEFFKKKGYKTVHLNEYEYGVGVSVFPEKELEEGEGEHGNTRLEACLRVVLAVPEKEK